MWLSLNRYILKDMTWPEVKEALKTAKVAIIPIGAQEQHGPHLAEGCDSFRAERFTHLLAEKCFPKVIVAPTINYGVSPHHMDFPGTITLKPETLIKILEDIVHSLRTHGIHKFLFVNAHGGNTDTIAVAAENLSREYEVEIAHTKFVDAAKETIQKQITSTYFGHACEREVSESLYLAPEIVREDKLTEADFNDDSFYLKHFHSNFVRVVHQYKDITNSGNLGNGKLGDYKLGEAIIQEALKNIAAFIEDFIKSTPE